MSEAVLKLPSGFAFDYGNLWGEGKVTPEEVAAAAGRIAAAARAIDHMRATGEVQGHLSKDGTPERVLFSQLPYIEPEHLNSPASIARLKEFGASLRHKVDAVISFGIGGSYLGNKVLFDVHCGEFWNLKSAEERGGWPKLYFSGNNLDPRRTSELLAQIEREARLKSQHGSGQLYRVCLVVISKSGSTIETTATFMALYDALRRFAPPIEVQVTAVTDPAEGEAETVLHRLARRAFGQDQGSRCAVIQRPGIGVRTGIVDRQGGGPGRAVLHRRAAGGRVRVQTNQGGA